MHRFKLIDYDQATAEVKDIYDETKREMGIPFVLNWFKCQAGNPTLLRGNWEKLKSTMLRGDVPFILKQLIIYNISKNRNSSYCAYVHGKIVDSLSESLTDDPKIKLTENLSGSFVPQAYKVAMHNVTKAALNTQEFTDEDFESLEEAGYSTSEIQELMALADLTLMLNTLAEISGIKIDNELMESI